MREACEADIEGVLDVLVRRGSFDVQACPGSGKTTTIATKIVVLLEEWVTAAGVCVVTHTNVAREEIQRLLRKSDVGRVALAPPHFVGTIQSFVETFLARPYLRAKGIAVEQVDNDAFASAAASRYSGGFHQLRAALKNKHSPGSADENISYQSVEYAAGGELTFGGRRTGFKDPNKPAVQQLAKLKEELSAQGLFRHGDMLHFACQYLDEFPWAVHTLRRRFPILIVDEMQDISPAQDALMNRIFPPDVIEVQRVGDIYQRIYDGDSATDVSTTFPREPVLDLGHSRRFGSFIAERIADVASRTQVIFGNGVATGGRHSVILFDEATALDVIPQFATIVGTALAHLDHRATVKAIGARKRPAGSGAFPDSLVTYIEGPTHSDGAALEGPESLCLRVERAKIAARENYVRGAHDLMIAVRMLIRRWGCSDSPAVVLARLLGDLRLRRDLGTSIRGLLSEHPIGVEVWGQQVRPFMAALESAAGCTPSRNAMSFAAWHEVKGAPEDLRKGRQAQSAVDVDVQTIHSVKGESHDATLVLETRIYEFDVPLALRAMVAKETNPKLSDRATMHRRRMFVAMSRPRVLLCMAAAAAHVDANLREGLKALGWDVVDLTAP